MMSKKQWFLLLCLFIIYLLLGAGIFYNIELHQEDELIKKLDTEKKRIDEYLNKSLYGTSAATEDFYEELTKYCDKPVGPYKEAPHNRKWDFYHSLFFVITVVSTIGYGNLAPTTTFGRIFMIFYGLIGIPMNGIVMVTLGTYFGSCFTKLYRRWKTSKMKYDTARLGLISQIILYLVPGFTFFIFLPSAIMVFFENWPYDVAVYYCFVTLTTIGFGDYVAGVNNDQSFTIHSFWIYKIFLLIWVIGGLGYVVMVLGYITRAMQSKKMQKIITQNIKRTPVKIREELRSLLQEFLFMKVKRVYKGEFDYTPTILERSQSCPDLTIYRNLNSPSMERKRAFSEGPHTFILHRIQSETDLQNIDQELTFRSMQQTDLLLKVVDALGNLEQTSPSPSQGYDGFPDADILASERYSSQWSLKTPPKAQRRRAVSDIRAPSFQKMDTRTDVTWYGEDARKNYETFLQRGRTFSEPAAEIEKTSQNLLTRLKNRFRSSSKDERNTDVEQAADRYLCQTSRGRVSILSTEQQEAVLEQTSIADFIRALSAISVPETMLPPSSSPKRKLGTAGLSPPQGQSPPRVRRLPIRPNLKTRRTSLMPEVSTVHNERRRFSLRPVDENLLAPPPYTPRPPEEARLPPSRRFSRIFNVPTISVSPVQRQVIKRDNKEDSSGA